MVSKKKAKKTTQPVNSSTSLGNVPTIPKGEIFITDEEEVPMQGFYGRSVELNYPKEYQAIDSLKVGGSGVFLQGKINIINAVRTRIQKLTPKKFMVKKINSTHCRLWRVADHTVIRPGGQDATDRARQTYKKLKKEKKIKGTWGGKRIPGTGKARGPKLTNKDGSPILPTVNAELNNVES